MSSTLTLEALDALAQWETGQDRDVRAALHLMRCFNHGRLMSKDILATFVVYDPDHRVAYFNWSSFDAALNGDSPLETAMPVLLLSSGERIVARFACDLALGRWRLSALDPETKGLMQAAFTEALGA